MCTVVLLRRPGHAWPLLLAANRDEMVEREWSPPARHWPDRVHVVGGLDHTAGGSWLAMNDDRVVAAVLNRRHALGPATDRRSRGELVLDALDHATATDAANAFAALDAGAWRPFNLVIADAIDAYWVRGLGQGRVHVQPLAEGVSMVTAQGVNEVEASDRARAYLPRFEQASPPDPDTDDWSDWQALLAATEPGGDPSDPNGAMHIETSWGFATVSSSLIALPAVGASAFRPVWRFATTWPRRQPFHPVPG